MALRFFRLESYFTQNYELYNCSSFPREYWQKRAPQNIGIGVFYMVSGLTYQMLYIPCLYVISQTKQLRHSCFKIMFFLGILDVICLTINADLSGYFSIVGANFCLYPTLMLLTGSIAIGMWSGSCYCCVLLALDRFIDLWKPHLMEVLFEGRRTWIWLFGCVLYISYFTLYEKPLVYDSLYSTWSFNPHIRNDQADLYTSIGHDVNNIIVVVALPILYTFICILLCIHYKETNIKTISDTKKKVFVQAILICAIDLIVATICVYMQYGPSPAWLFVVLQITWQARHGSAALIYLAINRTVRDGVIDAVLSSVYRYRKWHSESYTSSGNQHLHNAGIPASMSSSKTGIGNARVMHMSMTTEHLRPARISITSTPNNLRKSVV